MKVKKKLRIGKCKLGLFSFVILMCAVSQAQVSGQFVEENSVNISDRIEPNDTLYNKIKDYKAVMIGEIHGTQEAPEFLIGIVKSLKKNGKKVVVAFEISSDGLKDFKSDPTLDGLKKSVFFNSKAQDGRQCIAWAQMLVDLRKLNVDITYIDLDLAHKGDKNITRDSMMYENLNTYFKTDTSRVLVTLTGNVSNKLTPYKGVKTLAYFMQKDKYSCFKNKKILSLNHMYGKGTAMNWSNDGFKVRDVEGNADFYEYATPYDNYLFIYNVQEGYNGILFSKTLTASPSLMSGK
jgi:hypothetical protein